MAAAGLTPYASFDAAEADSYNMLKTAIGEAGTIACEVRGNISGSLASFTLYYSRNRLTKLVTLSFPAIPFTTGGSDTAVTIKAAGNASLPAWLSAKGLAASAAKIMYFHFWLHVTIPSSLSVATLDANGGGLKISLDAPASNSFTTPPQSLTYLYEAD